MSTESLSSNAPLDILDYDRDALRDLLKDKFDLSPFRAKQLFYWLYRAKTRDFADMTNLSKALREELKSRFIISRPKMVVKKSSKDGSKKYLFQLKDGSEVETVLICQPTRYTLCVSSQVGCAVGCKFCRTALMGLKRNLTPSEIIGQVIAVWEDALLDGIGNKDILECSPFQNIVFMGMGEPLHNKTSVISAVKILNDEYGLTFSGRRITVSTSGFLPGIKAFGESGASANLAISLNATTDEVRTEIMPINKRWNLEALLGELRNFPLKPGRRITFEYVMLGGVNDTEADLRRLPRLLAGIPAKVNLIPYNENAGLGFKQPKADYIFYWQKELLAAGMNSTIRWSKGDDISAACGQLATSEEKRAA